MARNVIQTKIFSSVMFAPSAADSIYFLTLHLRIFSDTKRIEPTRYVAYAAAIAEWDEEESGA